MQSPEETFFAEGIAAISAAPYGAAQPQMGQRAFRAHGDAGRERQRRRPVQEPHISAAAPAADVSGRMKRRTRSESITCASIR